MGKNHGKTIVNWDPKHQLRGPEPGGRRGDCVRAVLRQGLRVAVRPAVPGQREGNGRALPGGAKKTKKCGKIEKIAT